MSARLVLSRSAGARANYLSNVTRSALNNNNRIAFASLKTAGSVALRTLARGLSTPASTSGAGAKATQFVDTYARRHLGSEESTGIETMLKTVGYPSLDKFVEAVVPRDILTNRPLQVEPVNGYTENELTTRLKEIASQNKIFKTYIGQGYSGTIVPPVIQRNILECPEWYTSYTPYQPEISQGRLESLLNFQTMVADLTGMSVSNASLLDEGTAAAEAVIMSFHAAKGKKKTYYVDPSVNSQTINVVQSRATPLGINVVIGKPPATDATNAKKDYKDVIGCLVQYPATDGSLTNWSELSANIHASGGLLSVASDLLALTLIEPPSKFGADIVLGSSQRFGVPMGYGGPHAAFFAVADGQKRKMPGRLIGKSKDRLGNDAYRLALQTREQHIKREKATSNICTAQALLANMAAMYAVYHGPQGLKDIASRVFTLTSILAASIKNTPGLELVNQNWFDTLTIKVASSQAIIDKALAKQVNLYQIDPTTISISLDETVSEADLVQLIEILGSQELSASLNSLGLTQQFAHVDTAFQRSSEFLRHDVFNKYHTETELLRYVHHLQSKDLSLANSMIPLGSCTMKLNATTQMAPISWPEFSNLHPFVPLEQAQGYKVLLQELEADLAEITGFDNVSLQPNSGAQGEYAGLRVIKAYLESTGQGHRDICLIPVSAHGTNPASAVMAGMKVISIKCTANGELDLPDMIVKAEQYKDRLAAVMITYPSTFGVFEPGVKKAIDIVHSHGGQVYMDGANMNAQIGLTSPGEIGADVCHLNLHKTFCIPHGGGGPGMGPICVKSHLGPFLPSHPTVDMSEVKGELIDPAKAIQSISAAPWGSASILPISWAYIKLMGGAGLAKATKVALLNANYMMDKLRPHYPILYTNDENRCAHEFILDVRGFKETSGVEAIDIAKRLQDYGFHGPTMSWPVANTLMIEPTESESLAELDRFCDALIAIRAEISEIEAGSMPRQNNALKNSPHSTKDLLSAEWDRPYSREKAAFPLPYLLERKFWPSVTRLDDTYGDMNLFCTCEPPALD